MQLSKSFLQFLTAASASPLDLRLFGLEVSNLMSLSLQKARNSWQGKWGPPSARTTEGKPNSSHHSANARITVTAVVDARLCTNGYPEYRSTMTM